jgi:poly-gamma-glutamate capsule biosynthesis protein CapA/YwtB (metallophosphatase superfamily)
MIRRSMAVAILVVIVALLAYFVIHLFGSSGSSTAKPTAPSTLVPHTTTTKATNPVTMTFVGDTDLGTTPALAPNASTYFANVQSALSAPIEFMNLEGTLTDGTSSKCGPSSTECYAFRNPPSFAQIFKAAGFNVVNSANNHSHDFGTQGVTDTSAALLAAGISQAGLPGQIGLATEGKTKVAFVDFAPYPTTNNLLDYTAAKVLIAQAKAEAQIVVVYMHAGAEGETADHVTGQEETYVGEDRGNPKVFAHAAIDDGADLVVASGPHVLRGMEWYSGHLIDYSLGNFAGYQNFAVVGDLQLSAILRVTLNSNGSFVSGHYTSTLLNSVGQPAVDSTNQAATFVNQLSQADFGSAAAIIQPNGDITAPPPAP